MPASGAAVAVLRHAPAQPSSVACMGCSQKCAHVCAWGCQGWQGQEQGWWAAGAAGM